MEGNHCFPHVARRVYKARGTNRSCTTGVQSSTMTKATLLVMHGDLNYLDYCLFYLWVGVLCCFTDIYKCSYAFVTKPFFLKFFCGDNVTILCNHWCSLFRTSVNSLESTLARHGHKPCAILSAKPALDTKLLFLAEASFQFASEVS